MARATVSFITPWFLIIGRDSVFMAEKVIVYSAEWCPFCHRAIDFLKARGVEFEVRDVDNKEYAREVIEKSGQGGIPVIDIDGQIVIGFDQKRLSELLGLE